MPKADFMTPKAISNRIKSAGLQKLRWYCQMCNKQCRDENGFKCHTQSEGHLRQMRVFGENPTSIVAEFSREFEKGFMQTLSHRHGTKRVLCNKVYQEYISDKDHIHMNATFWSSLTGLCKYLGKEGKAVVDETEKGWYIQYVDRDPKTIAKQQSAERRRQCDIDEQERIANMISCQIQAHQNKLKDIEKSNNSENIEEEEGNESADEKEDEAEEKEQEKVEVTLKVVEQKKRKLIQSFAVNSDEDEAVVVGVSKRSEQAAASKSNIEQLIAQDTQRKIFELKALDKLQRTDWWLTKDIVVKIVNRKVGDGSFYKEKGVVLRRVDGNPYVGEVAVEGKGVVLRLDQEHLETVLPRIGGAVLVVNGAGRGWSACLLRIHEEDYCCDVRLLQHLDQDGSGELGSAGNALLRSGREIPRLRYEDVCKLHVPEEGAAL